MSEVKKIAVVGGGAVALSLAVKAVALRKAGFDNVPHLTVFEPNRAGAMWFGDTGYTDGEQFLCSPFSRDLVFPNQIDEAVLSELPPYASRMAGTLNEVLREYSHAAYLRDPARQGAVLTELWWEDAGRPAIRHRDFGDYLAWAFVRLQSAQDQDGIHAFDWRAIEVTGVVHNGVKWSINAGPDTFDEVVLTGNGDDKEDPGFSELQKVCADGSLNLVAVSSKTYWSQGERVRREIQEALDASFGTESGFEASVANPRNNGAFEITIVGGGGAACAVALDLLKRVPRAKINIVQRRPALVERASGRFHDSFFGNDEAWEELSEKDRSRIAMAVRGGVWRNVYLQLQSDPRVEFVNGSAQDVCIESAVSGGQKFIRFRIKGKGLSEVKTPVLIFCPGYDAFGVAKKLATEGIAEKINVFSDRFGEAARADQGDIRAWLEKNLTEVASLNWEPGGSAVEPTFESRLLETIEKRADRIRSITDENTLRQIGAELSRLGQFSLEDAERVIGSHLPFYSFEVAQVDFFSNSFGEDLTIKNFDSHADLPPGLCIPSIAGIQGPAASNLLALGWLSDRILGVADMFKALD